MEATEETVGFIDIGTNSVHVLVGRTFGGTAVTTVFEDKESIRLGDSLYSEGRLSDDAVEKAVLVVGRFARVARNMGAQRIVAMATCACREAPNASKLTDSLDKVANVSVISGTEEARLISLGVFGRKGPAERSIGIDIGGGSTEIYIREDGEDLFLDSLRIGAVRYSRSLDIDMGAPVSAEDYRTICTNVESRSYHATNNVHLIGFS